MVVIYCAQYNSIININSNKPVPVEYVVDGEANVAGIYLPSSTDELECDFIIMLLLLEILMRR